MRRLFPRLGLKSPRTIGALIVTALLVSVGVAGNDPSLVTAILIASPVLVLLMALVIAIFLHPYAGKIGWRYLLSKKRRTVSVSTFSAVIAVALGVWALVTVMSVTSGFQDEFRDRVLGVNAHVLVLKYGLDFEEYRDVVDRAREMPEVYGAAPFLINEMMLASGNEQTVEDGQRPRISGVLVKGVDPELMLRVLDLPDQLVAGSIEGLRAEGASPPVRPEDLIGDRDGDWDWLEGTATPDATPDETDAPLDYNDLTPEDGRVALPNVDVPTPEEAQIALQQAGDADALPEDEALDDFFDQQADDFYGDPEAIVRPTEELPGIVIGTTLAENVGLSVGDRVSVISPLAGLDTSMFGDRDNTPRSREFRVIGIFSAGFQEYDSRLVYVDLYEAQHFFRHGDSVTGVEIALNDLDDAPTVSRRLERVLGGGPYHTMDWQELNHNLFTALQIQKIILSLVISTIIIVAALTVIVTLIMIVLEKKREIAILKAMGARSFGMLLIFMVQGLLIGSAGTFIGLLTGVGSCLYLEYLEFPLDPHVYLIDHVPIRTSPPEFIITAAAALLICMIATVIPSWWAARQLPADGVRYQ